jgi:hypothetical protein
MSQVAGRQTRICKVRAKGERRSDPPSTTVPSLMRYGSELLLAHSDSAYKCFKFPCHETQVEPMQERRLPGEKPKMLSSFNNTPQPQEEGKKQNVLESKARGENSPFRLLRCRTPKPAAAASSDHPPIPKSCLRRLSWWLSHRDKNFVSNNSII